MSLFSGSDSGGLEGESAERLSIISLSDDDSSEGLFVDQDAEVKSEDTKDSSDEDDTDSQDDDDSSNDADTEDDGRSTAGIDLDVSDDDGEIDIDNDATDRDDDLEPNLDPDLDLELDAGEGDSNNDIDSDGDFTMINSVDDLPEHIKTLFANKPPRLGAPIQVKIEEQQQDGALAILYSSDGASESGSESEFEMLDEDLSDGERPKKRRRISPKRQNHRESSPESQQSNEQWRMPTEDELMEMYTQQMDLNMLKEQRALTFQERVNLAKLSAQIAAVEKKAQGLRGEGQEDHGASGHLSGQGLANSRSRRSEIPTPTLSEVHRAARAGEQSGDQAGDPTRRRSRQSPPKTPKEFWRRMYAEHGSALRNIDEAHKRKRQPQIQRNRIDNNDPATTLLVGMLKNTDPVMARAVQGALPLPGAIKATTRAAQFKALQDRILGNPHLRSTDDRVKFDIDQKNLEFAVRSFGHCKARALDGQWKIPGMKSPLYNHQLVAASWILRQEFSPEGPYGGILADQMGLGKTVEILAGMSGNRPTPEDVAARRHQTLIVAPAAVIGQWMREIEKHCEQSFIATIHHYKQSNHALPHEWQEADVM